MGRRFSGGALTGGGKNHGDRAIRAEIEGRLRTSHSSSSEASPASRRSWRASSSARDRPREGPAPASVLGRFPPFAAERGGEEECQGTSDRETTDSRASLKNSEAWRALCSEVRVGCARLPKASRDLRVFEPPAPAAPSPMDERRTSASGASSSSSSSPRGPGGSSCGSSSSPSACGRGGRLAHIRAVPAVAADSMARAAPRARTISARCAISSSSGMSFLVAAIPVSWETCGESTVSHSDSPRSQRMQGAPSSLSRLLTVQEEHIDALGVDRPLRLWIGERVR